MASLPMVVLVGHCMGGACISVAMEKLPQKISVAVFVAALMPGPNLDFVAVTDEFMRRVDSFMDTQFTFYQGPNNPTTSLIFGPNYMASKLYPLSPPEDLTLATSLVRPCRLYGDTAQLEKEAELSKEKYGPVRRVYIVRDQDNAINEDFQRWVIDNNPTDEVKVITGSDHMVMFSKPMELCSFLQEIGEKYS